MTKRYAIGADVGGSHISTILVDIQTGNTLIESKSEQKVNNQASAEEIFENWSIAIKKTMSFVDIDEIAGFGFAMPGPFDYENGVALLKNVAKYENLYGLNVGEELQRILNISTDIQFRFLNDALSFAVGECWAGKASVYKNVIAITLGTGFGSAFLAEGVPVIEGNRVPEKGYVFHIPYQDGIADDYFSTRWFIGEYEKRTGVKCKGVKEIAEEGTSESQKLFDDFGTNLGNFMIPIITQFGANCLVIGGNISGAYHLFGPSFKSSIENDNVDIEIVISEMMELAAMVGSSRLLDDQFWAKMKPIISKI